MSSPASPSVSVVILTLNEEVNIADCIASCAWCDDVHVLDSGSTDATRELAEQHGAKVYVNPFESFGAQRNWAIDNIPLKHDWVFHLDADERFTPELVGEMSRVLSADPGVDGFHIPSKLMFLGRWLKKTAGYPTYQMRLFHKSRMRFIDHGHGQREDPGHAIGRIDEPYEHYVFSKGLYDWFEKHNRYSSLEAIQVAKDGVKLEPLGFFSTNPVRRRRAWKALAYSLPFRAQIRFLAMVFLLGGITEGKPGITYARLMATYEQMISLKLRLLRQRQSTQHADANFEKDTVRVAKTQAFRPAGDALAPPPTATETPPAAKPQRQMPERTDDSGQILAEASPWTLTEKIGRALWMLIGQQLFSLTFHNWYGVRRQLLRLFGAKIGKGVRLRPSVHVEVPWHIDLRDNVVVGDHAILYSLGQITVGERTVVSQYAHLCAGTHDHSDRTFPLIRDPITIGRDCWIGADAYVGPKVIVGELSIIGARSSCYKDAEPRKIFVGNPAKPIKDRVLKPNAASTAPSVSASEGEPAA